MHSIAASLFARKDQLHFFRDIGYQHDTVQHCPLVIEEWEKGRCSCNPYDTFGECCGITELSLVLTECGLFFPDYDDFSCLERYEYHVLP